MRPVYAMMHRSQHLVEGSRQGGGCGQGATAGGTHDRRGGRRVKDRERTLREMGWEWKKGSSGERGKWETN